MKEKISCEMSKIVIGNFYENLAVELLGGKRTHYGNNSEIGEIDITDTENKRYVEVKGGHYKDRFIIYEKQIEHYSEMVRLQPHFENPEIYFALFSHKLKPVSDVFTENELEEKLSQNTDSLFLVSFDIIQKAREIWGIYYPRIWENYLLFKRKDVNLFFRYASKAIAGLGLKPEDYHSYNHKIKSRNTNSFISLIIKNKRFRPLKLNLCNK